MRWPLEHYQPIENPGRSEAKMLADHPDRVEKHPHRLLTMRREDRQLAAMRLRLSNEANPPKE